MKQFFCLPGLIFLTILVSCNPKDDVKKTAGFSVENDTVRVEKTADSCKVNFLANDYIPAKADIQVLYSSNGTCILNEGLSSSLEDISLTYIPDSKYLKADTVEYSVCIDGTCKSAKIFIIPFDLDPEPDPCHKMDTLLMNQAQEVSLKQWILNRTSYNCGFEWAESEVTILTVPVHGTIKSFLNESIYQITYDSNSIRYETLRYSICSQTEGCIENYLTIKIYP